MFISLIHIKDVKKYFFMVKFEVSFNVISSNLRLEYSERVTQEKQHKYAKFKMKIQQ